jgi:hypothetical protein
MWLCRSLMPVSRRLNFTLTSPLQRSCFLLLVQADWDAWLGISRPYALSVLPEWLKTLKHSAKWQSAVTGLSYRESLDK